MPVRPRLAVVVPAFNEEQALPVLHRRLAAVLDGLDGGAEVIYVDDGSRDGTWQAIATLAAADPRVRGLRLSRNFGKELALTAGLDHVTAEAAIVLDADGQDPPELIPQFVAKWREGCDVVYGRRSRREGESWLKRLTAAAFYRVMDRLSSIPVPRDTGDFRLLSRPVLDALGRLRERRRFMKGLFAWVGFRQCAIEYRREPRLAGRSKFDYWRLWNFALEGITSFSTAPLRVATYLGLFTALVAFAFGVWIVFKTLAYGDPVRGYPSLMTVVLFLGGVQLMALGLIGEYLGRLFDEAKQRPLYLVHERVGADPSRVGPIATTLAASPAAGGIAMTTVHELLRNKPARLIHVGPEVPVLEAIRLMAVEGIGAVLVMEGGRLLGIVSERDYARKVILHGKASADIPVREIMTSPVVTVSPEQSAQQCMELMTERRFRHLPVVEDGRVVGVISIGDLVKAVIEEQRQEIDQLQRYIAS